LVDNQYRSIRADQSVLPEILVVSNDPKMLKLLEMALSTEFECEVLTINSERNAAETAQRIKPDLVIIDARLLNGNASKLADRLHAIQELASVPTLLINTPAVWEKPPQSMHTTRLQTPFVLVDFYAAVKECLGRA
jgi:DNA-binding NtrC family response regulator